MLSQTVEASGTKQVSKLREQQDSLCTRFLAVLGSVALLVGSPRIMNLMLASISERKAEIGPRMVRARIRLSRRRQPQRSLLKSRQPD